MTAAPLIEVADARVRFGEVRGAGRRRLARRARRMHRSGRPQRRRQIDARQRS